MPLPMITNRLRVEKFDARHLNNPNYLVWLSDRENLLSLNLMDYLLTPVSQDKLALYFHAFQENPRNVLFAVSLLDSDQFIGTATLREIGYQGLFDLGILVGEKSVRGQGIAREVIASLVKYAFSDLRARKICSSFADDNFAVLLAFLKNGFKIEGFQREQQMSIDGQVSNRYIVGLVANDLS